MKIEEMAIGKGLDTLVAEKVMGWEVHEGYCVTKNGLRTWEETSYKGFSPSTDISAAWEVIDKMKFNGGNSFVVLSTEKWVSAEVTLPDGSKVEATALNAPEAICKAALMATI
jgi:hypothetical protein